MFADLGGDEDMPPIDTSTVMGEKLAQVQEVIGDRMKQITSGMGGKLNEMMGSMAGGGLGMGQSALEAGQRWAEGQAILPELEQFQARLRGK